MNDQPDLSPSFAHTLHGDELSWLHLVLAGALPARYRLPHDPSEPSAPVLRVDEPGNEQAVASGSQLDLLDPEGVTLASVAVDATEAGWVSGAVTERSGFSIVDNIDLRRSPAESSSSWPAGPVFALWVDAPVPFTVREAARAAARSAGATVAEIVPIPTGHETSRVANLPARLARVETTREGADRVVVIPWPQVPWDDDGIRLRAHVAAVYGATELFLAPGTGRIPSDTRIPVREVDVPTEHGAVPTEALDQWVTESVPLPSWAAESPVAAELRLVHRPQGRSGLTVLLSGLSGSGKSTVARALAVRLVEHESRSVSLLDGDVVRHHLSKGLGFNRADRVTNVLRIGFVASEITKAGGIAVCCPIAPYDETRKQVRAMVQEHGQFVLVHVATPLEECERRDRKGLYAKARRGEIPEFTGISDPYDLPTDAEVVVDTTGRSIEACVDDVYSALIRLGAITPSATVGGAASGGG